MSVVTQQLQQALTANHLRTGHWFHHILVARLRAHEAKHPPEQTAVAAEPASEAERIIRKTAMKAAALGTGAAGITTMAEVWTAETQGVAGLLAVPAAAVAMVGDLATRAWITIEMSCDVAELFGVRFDPNDPADLARLYAVALSAISHPQDSDARGHELLERLVPVHSEEVSASIGSMLGNETLLRNVVPVIGLLTSGWSSYHMTRQLGQASMQYARGRRALTDAFAEVEQVAPDARELLIEGIWFVFTADGQLDTHEAALLAHFVHGRPEERRAQLLARMHDDEAGWLERLEQLPEQARSPFMHALETAAALDTELHKAESDLLAAAARRLGTATNTDAVQSLAGRFRDSGLGTPPRVETH